MTGTETSIKDSVLKAQHTCSRFFKYLKTYAFYPQKGIYFLKGNKILYKIVVLCFTFKGEFRAEFFFQKSAL